MAKAQGWSKAQTDVFISVLQKTGNVSAAARAAKVTRASAYEKRQNDESFRMSWASALEESLDDLEEELRRRAFEGTDKPVYYAGKQIGGIKSYNDALGMFLLRSRRKEVFGDKVENLDVIETPDPETVHEKLISKLNSIEE